MNQVIHELNRTTLPDDAITAIADAGPDIKALIPGIIEELRAMLAQLTPRNVISNDAEIKTGISNIREVLEECVRGWGNLIESRRVREQTDTLEKLSMIQMVAEECCLRIMSIEEEIQRDEMPITDLRQIRIKLQAYINKVLTAVLNMWEESVCMSN